MVLSAKHPVDDLLRRKIAREGPLRFDMFMQTCMSLPGQGYYQSQQAVGKQGDFVTSPEVSQIFGEMLGIWLLDRWFALEQPKTFTLLELGPGKATLMADALRLIEKVSPAFIAAMELALLEQNPVLRKIQAEVLKDHSPVWLEDLRQSDLLNPARPLLVIANEFFDALPVRLFKSTEKGWQELSVDLVEGDFAFKASDVGAEFEGRIPRAETSLSKAKQSVLWYELCTQGQQIISELAGFIKQARGAMMIVDYGYEQPDHRRITVQAVRDHRQVDLFHSPGESDLSAHVDFAVLALRAEKSDLKAWPLMTQQTLLYQLGGKQRLEQLCKLATPQQKADLEKAFERLTAPDQMGFLFKALCLTDRQQSNWLSI